jgi:hypothetical protein
MEGITGYLILTLGTSLVLLSFVALSEKSGGWHPQPIHGQPDVVLSRTSSQKPGFFACFYRLLVKGIPLLVKDKRDTVIKGLVVTGIILFSRKLIYYVRFDGVVQTKFSIWWMDGNAQILLFISIMAFFMIGLGLQMLKTDIEKEGCLPPLIGIIFLAVVLSVMMNAIFEELNIKLPITGRHLILFIFAPLLEFKILCSGKYLGLLTGILSGYFIVTGYKKLTPRIRKHRAKSMIIAQLMILIAGLMFLIFLGFGFYRALGNPGDWERQLNNKVHVVSGETDMMELLEAVHSIDREQARYQSLEQIAAFIVKEKQFRWKKEIYQLVIDAILSYDGHRRGNLLEKIALWIAANGDVPWAKEVAMSIRDKTIRNNVLKELREKIEVK